jgi:hypothetical protein
VWRAWWERVPGDGASVAELVAGLVEPFAELVGTREGRVLVHLLARTALPSGRLPNVATPFTPGPFEVRIGRALPGLAPQEVAERCALAFSLVMYTYGRPLARQPAEQTVFPATATVAAFVLAGLTAPEASTAAGASAGAGANGGTDAGAGADAGANAPGGSGA